MGRLLIAALTICLVGVALAGCGGRSEDTPVACLEGASAYLDALGAAPGEVKLSGDVPISDCLVENQTGGELATVGTAMVAAATKLNAEARTEPGGGANLQLGYLIGAAQKGAESTEGIHAELTRRLSVAARYNPEGPLPATFTHTYRQGFDAGHAHG